jgi:3-deoxy-D-manno-octulosonic-acid transferase
LAIILDCVYLFFFVLALPLFLAKKKLRQGLFARLKAPSVFPKKKKNARSVILLHCVSVGEVAAAAGLVNALKRELPQYEVVVSTTTVQGMESARKRFPDHRSYYFPPDFSWSVGRFLGALSPRLIILLELDVWPNFLASARERRIPVMLASARMTPVSHGRYLMFLPLFRRSFGRLSLVLAQNEQSRQRLIDVGVPQERVKVGGNIKYDSVQTSVPADEVSELRELLQITPEQKVIVAGSTYQEEERILLEIFKRLKMSEPGLRLILAPRQLHRVQETKQAVVQASLPFSTVTALRSGESSWCEDVVILDTSGELAKVYSVATVAFVGGSLIDRGGHNILEPAALGIPTLFGPHTYNFLDSTKLLLDENAAVMVADRYELEEVLGKLLEDSRAREVLGTNARRAILTQKGAVSRHLTAIKSLLGVN